MNPLWQVLLSLVAGSITATAAWFGVRHTVRGNDRATQQRELAARREEWWRRFTWAAELALAESPAKRGAGLKLMTVLARSDLAQDEEWQLLYVFQARVLDTLVEDLPKSAKKRTGS